MNFRTTYILFGVIAILLVVFTVAMWVGPTAKTDEKFVFPALHDKKAGEFKLDEVDAVEINREAPTKEKLTFTRDTSNGRWTVNGLRADKGAVQNLIRQVVDAEKTEGDSPRSLSDWGLEPPQEVVTLKRGDKPPIVLNVGHVSPGETDAVVYVSSADNAKNPVAARKSMLENVLKGVNDFRERELLTSAPSDIQRIKLTEGTLPAVVLEKASDGSWKYLEPFKSIAESASSSFGEEGKAPNNVQSLLNDLTSLTVEGDKGDDFVKDNVKSDELAAYNLGPKDDVLTISVKRSDENKKTSDVTVRIGVGKTVHTKADDKIDKYYAFIEGENSVVRISAKKVGAIRELIKKPDSLRDRHLVKAPLNKEPDAIRIRNAHGKLEFLRGPGISHGEFSVPGEWKMYRGDEAVAIDSIVLNRDLIPLLTGLSVESFPDPAKLKDTDLGVANEEKAEAVVEVWFDGIAPDEKKDEKKDDKKDEKKPKPKLKDEKKPSAKLIFGKKDPAAKTVAVKRITADEDKGTLLWVKDIVLDKVAAKPLDYMDKKLPSFVEIAKLDTVTKLEVTRPGKDGKAEDWVLVREAGKADAPWKIEKPEHLKGRSADRGAVDSIVRRLDTMYASTLEAEKVAGDVLENTYGLGKAATTKAVVTVVTKVMDKDETKTYEFSFGKAKDDNLVYAKQGWKDMVFAVDRKKEPSSLYNDLQTKEFLDHTVLSFDPTKVKSVKIVGWYSLTAMPITVELESKNGQWSVKTPPMKMPNTVEVTSFVVGLSNLRAERFAAHNVKEPDASYEFDLKKDAMHITLTIEGQDKPIEVKIGKKDGDTGYFATISSAPGDIIVVSKALFEKAREKPAYFYGQ